MTEGGWTRRQFLRRLGFVGAVVAAPPLLTACQSSTATQVPPPSATAVTAAVAPPHSQMLSLRDIVLSTSLKNYPVIEIAVRPVENGIYDVDNHQRCDAEGVVVAADNMVTSLKSLSAEISNFLEARGVDLQRDNQPNPQIVLSATNYSQNIVNNYKNGASTYLSNDTPQCGNVANMNGIVFQLRTLTPKGNTLDLALRQLSEASASRGKTP